MSGLESLTRLIYHEKQQPGSMLCAQHALNSLMQGSYFTAPDLSEIARRLDSLEASYDENNAGVESTNMDDTGFFSVQVLEEALKVWGLTLVRWRSEDMRPYHAVPHTQLAFILNLQQHWFTLRRFGKATTVPASEFDDGNSVPPTDPGDGHWYNINSSLPSPEWVSRTYLGMVIQQAEAEGYSVFAICQVDPMQPLALPRMPADTLASTLEVTSGLHSRPSSSSNFPGAGNRLDTSRSAPQLPPVFGSDPMTSVSGFEDEDMELQAALQASLMGDSDPGPGSSFIPPDFRLPPIPSGFIHDEIAASMARGQAELDRVRREQEMAFRGTYDDEVEERFVGNMGSADTPRAAAAREAALLRGQRAEEEEMVNRAIEESRRETAAASSSQQPLSQPQFKNRLPIQEDDDDDDDEDFMDADDGDEEEEMVARLHEMKAARQSQDGPPAFLGPSASTSLPQPRVQPIPSSSSSNQTQGHDNLFGGDLPPELAAALAYGKDNDPGFDFVRGLPNGQTRYLDDEDSELQAALKASLESAPAGLMIPTPPPIRNTGTTPIRKASGATPSQPQVQRTPQRKDDDDEDDEEDDEDEEPADAGAAAAKREAEEAKKKEEMRLARLARFGK